MRQNRLEIARMVSNPKVQYCRRQAQESWGEPVRSLRSSKELENLLNIRETLAKPRPFDRGGGQADCRRADAHRPFRPRPGHPARAATLEITAKRTNPQDQSAKIIYDDKGKAVGWHRTANDLLRQTENAAQGAGTELLSGGRGGALRVSTQRQRGGGARRRILYLTGLVAFSFSAVLWFFLCAFALKLAARQLTVSTALTSSARVRTPIFP